MSACLAGVGLFDKCRIIPLNGEKIGGHNANPLDSVLNTALYTGNLAYNTLFAVFCILCIL